jgi:hypothetical protein
MLTVSKREKEGGESSVEEREGKERERKRRHNNNNRLSLSASGLDGGCSARQSKRGDGRRRLTARELAGLGWH